VGLAPSARVSAIHLPELRRLRCDLEADGRRRALDLGDYRDPFVARLRALGIESVYAVKANVLATWPPRQPPAVWCCDHSRPADRHVMGNQTLLPPADTLERYLAIRADHARLQPGVTALCERLSLRGADSVRFADGSLPVYAVGHKRVLKLYPRAFHDSYQVEHRVLAAIHRRLPIPTPAVEHAGEFEGWGYILMERLHGQLLTTAWSHLPAAQHHRLASQLGEALAALHALTAPELDALGPPDWDRFLAQQRAGCVDRQRQAGLDRTWLEQIPSFLDRVTLDPGPRRSCCTPRSCASTCW
jgi:hypothetical protein